MAKGQIRFYYFANDNMYNNFASTSGIDEDYLYVVEEQGKIYKGNKLIAQSGETAFNIITETLGIMNTDIQSNKSRIGALEGKIDIGENQKIQALLDNKVDKENGKGLSDTNFTQAEKEKLAGIEAGANKFSITIDSSLSSTSTNPVQNKVVKTELNKKASTSLEINGHALTSSFNLTAEEVEADPKGTAASAISAHNEDDTAHDSIQLRVNTNTDNISEISETLEAHIDANNEIHLTQEIKEQIEKASNYADKNHTEKAFKTISVGGVSISADNREDNLILKAGDGVTLSADASTDTITISSLDGVKNITTGSQNGTIKVDGSDVAVYGLNSMAYKNATTFTEDLMNNVTNTLVEPHTTNNDIHVTLDNKTNWNNHMGSEDLHIIGDNEVHLQEAYDHSQTPHAPSNAERNVITEIQVNGTKVSPSSRKVNISVPTSAGDIGAAPSEHNHDDKYDAKNSASAAETNAKTHAESYVNDKIKDLASNSVVDNKINTHNSSSEAHNDIRGLISNLATKVNNFLNVNDEDADQLSEILELINNNKGTLESLTSSKVNISDIVDNLTTSSATKVLSAKQGVALKGLINTLTTEVNKKASSTDLNSHKNNSDIHFTTAERTKLSNIQDEATKTSFTRKLTSGTEIGTLTINGTATKLYSAKDTHYESKNTVEGNSTTNGVYLKHFENSSEKSSHLIEGAGSATVTTNDNKDKIIIDVPIIGEATSSDAGLMSTTHYTKVQGLGNPADIVYTGSIITPDATNNRKILESANGQRYGLVYSNSTTVTGFSVCPINNGKVYYKDTNTTYTGGDGIKIGTDNEIINTGVLKVEAASSNGKIKVDNVDIPIYGLKSAAYTDSSSYLASNTTYAKSSTVGGKADSAAEADYATEAGTATTAGSASKLTDDKDAGSNSQPVYFKDGIPVACTGLSSSDEKVAQTALSSTATSATYPLIVGKTPNTEVDGVNKVTTATLTGAGSLTITELKLGNAKLSYDSQAQALVISFS